MNRSKYHNKYDPLLDDEVWAFIERTNACYPENTVNFTIEKQREIYDAMCKAFFAGYPGGITSIDSFIQSADSEIGIRQYSRQDTLAVASVIYCHGGGYVVGGLESHDDICAEICKQTGYQVFSVDYRLSPEYLHPAACQDTLQAFQYVASLNDLPIVLAGDSAGGNLVAATCHLTRKNTRKPAGQVLIYPELGGDMSKGSYVEHSEAPLLNIREVEYYAGVRGGGLTHSQDPAFSPLADNSFDELPPTVIFSAKCDPLCDDGRQYRDRITGAGGRAWWINEPGLVHGYLRARHSSDKAGASFQRIIAAIAMLGANRWEFD